MAGKKCAMGNEAEAEATCDWLEADFVGAGSLEGLGMLVLLAGQELASGETFSSSDRSSFKIERSSESGVVSGDDGS